MVRNLLTLITLTTLAGGCAATSDSFQVKGDDPEVVLLSGAWEGEYQGVESGRNGVIEFELGVGRHTAQGKVLMFPEGISHEPEPLAIRFAEVEDGKVNGTIEPYLDPQCNCTVETEFLGKLRGDHISGTFITRAVEANLEQKGHWSVTRIDG